MLKINKRLIALGLAFVMTAGGTVSATASNLSKAQNEKAQAESNLSAVNGQINEIKEKQADLQKEIDDVNTELVEVLVNIDIINEEIAEKKIELEQAKSDLAAAKEKEADQYAAMKERIAYMYRNGNGDFLSALVGDNNFTEVLNKVDSFASVYDSDRTMLVDYQNTKVEVENLVAKVKDEEEDLLEDQQSLTAEQERLEGIEKDLQSQMDDFDAQLSTAKTLAAQYKATIVDANAVIAKELAAIKAAQSHKVTAGASSRPNNNTVTNQGTQSGTVNTPAVTPGANTGTAVTPGADTTPVVTPEVNTTPVVTPEADTTPVVTPEVDTTPVVTPETDTTPVVTPETDTTPVVTPEADTKPVEKPENGSTGGNSIQDAFDNAIEDVIVPELPETKPEVSTGQSLSDFATQFVGNPYVYGGTSLTNGADCSGFVMSVYAQYGYQLPHSSAMMQKVGTSVSIGNIQPGDIVCYGGHVAIYIGNGQVVHASSPEAGIKISNITYRTVLDIRRVIK